MVISTRRSACLVLSSCRPMASIDTTRPFISRSPRVHLLAPIFFTSYQAQQTSNSHISPNSLALTFHTRIFYILSNVLAYIQDFPLDHDCIYVNKDVVK